TGVNSVSVAPPIINNKGEVAFISWFSLPNAKDGRGESYFVRGADGNWRVTRQGEKADNLPKGINNFSSTYSFNDNGDLTFIASFEDPSATPAPASAPASNDPLAATA